MENNPSPQPPLRILVVALSGIGNFIMQSPAITALKKKFPQAAITVWVAPRGTRILAENHPAVDHVIEAPIKGSLPFHFNLVRRLRHEHFDISFVLSPGQLVKSAFYLVAAGIPKRIGNAYPFAGRAQSTFGLTDAIPEDNALHDIEQNLKLLQPLGIPYDFAPTTYSVTIPESAKHNANQFLKKNDLSGNMLIGLHAGSAPDFLWKRWPLSNFAAVANYLVASYPGCKILLFGGQDELAQKKELQSLIHNPSQVIRVEADLLTSAAIMQACRLIITNDSGLMHLSAAVGVPTLGLFGPTDEHKTGPRGLKSYILRAPGTKPMYNTETNYHLGDDPAPSMLAITPQSVTQQADLMLHQTE